MLQTVLSTSPRQTAFDLPAFSLPAEPAAPRLVFNPRRNLPSYSLLVGACEDGLPLLLDLLHPSTGPVLVTGDRGCGKTSLLQAICRSAGDLNGPAEVRPLVITSRPHEWHDLRNTAAYIVPARDTASVERLLVELGALYEQRREGDLAGTAVTLFIDELPSLLRLDFAAQVQLHHLLGSGAAARIWTFAAVEAGQALNLHYWINLFHTRLIGSISLPAVKHELARHAGLEAVKAGARRFSYWDVTAWRSFWAPERMALESNVLASKAQGSTAPACKTPGTTAGQPR